MAQYENLKDYFQNKHIKLIQYAVSNYLKDDAKITETVIQSLVCTDDDAEYNAEFDLGVSVKAVGAVETDDLSFIVTVRGNIEQRFKDIRVKGVKRVSSDTFPDDNILSQFILPDIQSDDVERIGNDLYGFCAGKGLFVNYKLHIEKLVSDGMIYFAPLPNNCLGRVILSEADVEIIKNVQTEYGLKPEKFTIRAAHGTILLNYEKYAKEMDGGLRITVAHELVHTLFHDRFLKLLQLLGKEKVDLHSSTEPITFDENMSDIQKALCIAEWQADVLAMRLAIPGCTIDDALNTAASYVKNNYKIKNRGDRNQACVKVFSKIYGVSCYVAKERMRQLGYDFVDGTIIECDGKPVPPFIFPQNTLKDDETFIIDRDNYERLMFENEEFAELINNGRYIYLGYVVCMLSSKYVAATFNSDDVKLELTDYAREHTDECLIRFKYKILENSDSIYPYEISTYLNKMPEYNEVVPESFELCDEDTGLDESTIKLIKEYNDELTELNSNEKSTLANTIIYHMKKTEKTECPIDQKELVNRTRLKSATISKICKGKTKKPDIRNVMVLCIALELTIEESYDLFEKAKYNLRKDTLQNRAYRFIIDNQYYDLDECNRILRYFNQEELPYHKGQ